MNKIHLTQGNKHHTLQELNLMKLKTFSTGLKIFLALMFGIGFIPAEVQAQNQPPVLETSYVTPEEGYQGIFTAVTEWSDPDGDTVTDVVVRYRQGQEAWSEVLLDPVPDEKPFTFSADLLLTKESGPVDFSFRASDVAPSGGPTIHTTEWVGAGTLFVRTGKNGDSLGCFGANLSTPEVIYGSEAPVVHFERPSPFNEGERVLLTASADVDVSMGAKASYYWCSDIGTFERHSDFPDFSSVWLNVPLVAEDSHMKISVKVSDGIGWIDKATWFAKINEAGNSSSANPPPTISVSTSNLWISGEAVRIDLSLQDFDGSGHSSAHLLTTDLLLRLISSGTVVDSVTGIRGAPIKYPWRAKNGLAHLGPFEIIAVTTDGNTRSSSSFGPITIQQSHKIEGFVVRDDGTSLAGVQINLSLLDSATSDSTGHFGFVNVSPGSFELTPTLEGFEFSPSSALVEISEQQPFSTSTVFIGSETVYPPPTGDVSIDIKPGSSTNPINPTSNGKIPVAILSSPDFDAPSQVVLTSLTFGRTGAEESLHYRGNGDPNCSTNGDHNSDGLPDIKCHFYTQIAGFQAGDTEGFLRGETIDGDTFEGSDLITIVGSGNDEDADGVDDDTEDAAPNNGDGNGDGVIDSTQLNVTSLPTSNAGYFSLVSSPGCTNTSVAAVSVTDLPTDPGYQAPEGFLSFALEGCSSSDTMLYIHSSEDFSTADYRRHGPTATNPADHWYTLPAEFGTVEIDGAIVSTAAFTLVDGGIGDDDGTVNGTIVDPGGPALIALDIPAVSRIGLLLLALLVTAGAVILLRRR